MNIEVLYDLAEAIGALRQMQRAQIMLADELLDASLAGVEVRLRWRVNALADRPITDEEWECILRSARMVCGDVTYCDITTAIVKVCGHKVCSCGTVYRPGFNRDGSVNTLTEYGVCEDCTDRMLQELED